MKNLFIFIGIACLIFILQSNCIAKAQEVSNTDFKKEIDDNYQKLLSVDFKERDRAVFFLNSLKKEELNEKIYKVAVDLLKMETERRKEVYEFARKGGVAENLPKDIVYANSERFGMYYVYLCELTGKSGDKRLLPLLVEHCLGRKVLLYFGDAAVEAVIEVLKTSDIRARKRSAIFVLAEMLKPKKEGYVASGEVKNKIKKVLIQATSENDRHIRQVSVRALGESGDKDVIPILEKIAKSDPFLVRKKDAKGNVLKEYYLIRKEARKALKKIRENDLEK